MIKLLHSTEASTKAQNARADAAVAKLLARNDLGFFQITERSENWQASQARGQELRLKYKKLVILGIGGSSLGGIALQEGLNLEGLFFFENVDAHDFWQRLEKLSSPNVPWTDIHWVIVSKSGKTVETLTQTNFVNEFLQGKNLTLATQATVISELKSNPLTDWARSHKVPILEIPEDVGGRFSVLTPVGLLPLAFCGVDLNDVRAGARESLKNTDLVSRLTAQYLDSFENEKWISIFWSYCNRLKYFGLWIEQLWAESLGKKHDRSMEPAPRASTPISLVGANDQHSVLQQVAEGAKDKFVTFVRVRESENYGPKLKSNLFKGEDFVMGKNMGELLAAEAEATQKALYEAGVPSLSLEVDAINSVSMGALFMLFELVVGALGEAHNINAFDQPGVELGKRLAKNILLK